MYKFIDLASDVLQESNAALTVKEMWDKAIELGLDVKLGTTGKTPMKTLASCIYVDMKNKEHSIFVQTDRRPAKFALASIASQLRPAACSNIQITLDQTNKKFHERDLHILLSSFVYSNKHFECRTKTIFHEYSKNKVKGYNEWLHPDLVGVYFPFDGYQSNTLKLLETLKDNPYKLFSFEVKVSLNFSNLRKYYFQAVSNSSWAHEGYLVTLNIETDTDFMDELTRLNNAFGIGIIKLDPYNISQSEMICPALCRETLDWSTVDRLVYENPDFKNFIDGIMDDITIGKPRSPYDNVFEEDEDAYRYATEKGIIIDA